MKGNVALPRIIGATRIECLSKLYGQSDHFDPNLVVSGRACLIVDKEALGSLLLTKYKPLAS
jgi:hypothetical protein